MQEHVQSHKMEAIGPSDREFGFVFTAFFLIIALYPLLGDGAVRLWAVVLAIGCFSFAVIKPTALAPFNHLWMFLGKILHRIVSPIALGIVFFLTIAPIGLVMRLLGKNPLSLQFDPTVHSYWIKRDPAGPTPDSLNHQF